MLDTMKKLDETGQRILFIAPELSMSMTGLQMAFAYVGSCLAPPLFGLLAQNVTPRLYPWYLAVGLVVMVIMSESLHAKKAAEHR